MSTLVPLRSAKRQRLADRAEDAAAEQLAQSGQHGPRSASVVVQFQSGQDGSALGPSISLPAETSRKQLEMIVNRLRKDLRAAARKGKGGAGSDDEDEEDMPYAFHVALAPPQATKDGAAPPAPARLPVANSLQDDVLSAAAAKQLGLSTEDVLTIVFEPQAVFRVRPVTRVSSTLSGHSSPILCSVFSPTGSLLLTGSGDHTARLWDLDAEMPLHSLEGHRNWVLCADWEGRERKVATGDMNGEIFVWDALDGRKGNTGKKAWGTRSGKKVEEERAAEAAAAAAPAEGASTETTPSAPPKKLSVAEKRALRHAAPQGHVLKGHTKWITALSWEPIHLNASSPRLASSSKDGTVRVWNVGTLTCAYVLGGHTASVNAVRWGGEGLLYTASSDRTVKVWDSAGGKLVRSLEAHAHWVNTLSLSTDWVLRTGPFDHLGRLFDRAQSARLASPDERAKAAAAIAALSDDELDRRCQLAALHKYQDATANGTRAELVISGSDDHTLFLWPYQGQNPQAKSAAAGAAAGAAAPSPKKPLARLTGHQKVVNHVAFSPDGRLIASASFDSSIKVWDARAGSGSNANAGGKFLCNLRAHVGAVYRIAWSSDSRMLVSASKDSTLKLWDMRAFKLKVDLPGHEDEVYCVDFVADKVASGGRDRVVKIWKH